MSVTVLTPTMPGRELMLADAIASVAAQTVAVDAHLIRCQPPPGPLGPVHIAAQRNALLPSVTTDWVATLDDDDRWLADNVEMAADAIAARPDADVVYTWPDPEWAVHRVNCNGWPSLLMRARIRSANFIPSGAFIRTWPLAAVGGWQTEGYADGRYTTGATWEDWDLWIRLADAGARFVCVPEVGWHYNMEGDHHSLVGH